MDQQARFLLVALVGGLLVFLLSLYALGRLGGEATVPSDLANLPGYGDGDNTELPSISASPSPNPTTAGNFASFGSNSSGGNYTIKSGDTLAGIAAQFGVSMTQLINANGIVDPNLVTVGQTLVIPGSNGGSTPIAISSNVKLVPDDELVFGPNGQGFDISLPSVIPADSFLRGYTDQVEGTVLDGIAIVELVAERTRVHPRLLLVALEHRSGWVTQADPFVRDAPMRAVGGTGLYRQLEWAANRLNLGFYGRSEGGMRGFTLSDGTAVRFSAEINHGTAGVQLWLGSHTGATSASWQAETDGGAFLATYERLFGSPFAYTQGDEGVAVPEVQPPLTLPWSADETWFLTGGPHGGWNTGSAWAALDFVPPGEQLGCYDATAWLTAVADGVVTRSNFGAVVLDLDGDGYAGTGWAVVYQHVATNERVEVGTELKVGDRIGHPSCEGGFSTGTHLHISRTHNGRWISADSRSIPFNLGGWQAGGLGAEYNGTLTKDGARREATVGRLPMNAISAEP